MNAEQKAKWVEALRSGRFPQGRGTLHHDGAYCCLGVWCAVNGYTVLRDSRVYCDADEDANNAEFAGGVLVAPDGREQDCEHVVAESAIGISNDRQSHLASMNDSGDSFEEIADYIAANIPTNEVVW